MISIHDLRYTVEQRVIFESLSFQVGGGKLCAVTGKSGSGKSTLLNLIGTLKRPDSGTIEIDGIDITRLNRRKRRLFRRDYLGYMFQDYALIPDRTVYYNLKIAQPKDHLVSISSALEKVSLPDFQERAVYGLSGGEQQRVALARLVLRNPRVILADEPTGALDHDNSRMVMDMLVDFARSGATVLVATHDDYVVSRSDTVFTIPIVSAFHE